VGFIPRKELNSNLQALSADFIEHPRQSRDKSLQKAKIEVQNDRASQDFFVIWPQLNQPPSYRRTLALLPMGD